MAQVRNGRVECAECGPIARVTNEAEVEHVLEVHAAWHEGYAPGDYAC